MENSETKLRKVPKVGIFDFSYKIESIREDALVITQPKRDYWVVSGRNLESVLVLFKHMF